MEIKGENYSVTYDPAAAAIKCRGSLRLYGASGYADIVNLLNDAAERHPPAISLDLRELQFLNSSGINTLSKFVIKVRNLKVSRLAVLGSGKFPWQKKSLKNLLRLMPDLNLTIE